MQEEIALDYAKAAEATRLALLKSPANAAIQQASNLHLTRHARRVYVGNLPIGMTEVSPSRP